MTEKIIPITSNLEARSAALFVQTAGKFKSVIKVNIGDKVVNAKSIMGIISLGIFEGQTVKITAEGEDEDLATAELEQFLNSCETTSV